MSLAFEGRRKEYVAYHHLTEVPASIASWKNRHTSLNAIETNLHQKLAQRCTTDKQMYNEILRLFKDQYRRSGRDESCMTGIDKDDFFQMLAILGLFASRAQSDQLFEKYDANGSGNLSIHEFWVQARPSDYRSLSGFEAKQKVDEAIMHRARKRMFIKESLLHTAVAPPTVHQSVYSIPIERLLSGIRDKIRQNSMVDYTLSTPRTRRFLQKLFEYNDPMATGQVDTRALKRVLDHINFCAMSEYYIQAIASYYPGSSPDMIDYVKLCLDVYPQEARAPLTSVLGQGPVYKPPQADRPFSATMRPSPFNSGSMTQRPASSMDHRRFAQTGRGSRPASRSGSMTSRGQPRPPSQGSRRPMSRA